MYRMDEHNQVLFPRKLLKRFIALYKEQRCLWDRECQDYRIKSKKQDALAKLTSLVQEYDPNATRVHVLRKIDSLRACVRREYKRVVESRLNATCENDVYKPSLWYFNLFRFVFEDPNGCSVPIQNADNNRESEGEEDAPSEEDHDNDSYPAEYDVPLAVVEVNERPATSKKHQIVIDDDPFKGKRAKSSTEVDDEYDAIGINVAAKLRYLPPNMRILAEKLINDVLFQAQVNGLNSSTKIVTSDPFKR